MAPTIKKIIARQEKRKRDLGRALERILVQLQEKGALRIVLFGSYAGGKVRSFSDLDLICVMPSTRSGKEWMKRIYEVIDREVGSDILAFTEEELEEALPVSRFLRHVMKTGKVIYERGSED